jgi:hypothetical protein
MVVVIAGALHTRVPVAMTVAKACRINTAAAIVRNRSMRATAVRACRLNTRIIPRIAAMVARAGDRTLSVTTTVVAVVKAARGNLRADSLPVAAAAGSGIAPADARLDDANGAAVVGPAATTTPPQTRTPTPTETTMAPGYAAQVAPCHPVAFSV